MYSTVSNTLLGLAIGDAYGVHFEFMSKEYIAQNFKEMPQISLGGGPFGFLPGGFSDDTEMALLTLSSLIHKGCVQIHHIKELYTIWSYHANDVGIQTKIALQQGIIDSLGEGNGALMRILPSVVLMHDVFKWDIAFIKKAVHAISAITHDNATIHAVNDFFIDVILSQDLSSHQQLIKAFMQTTGNSGWVMNTARIVYETVLQKEMNLLESFWYIIQQGGDTDTACAIYGAIQGYQNPYLLERLAINSFLNQESQTKLKRLMRQISL